MVEVQTFYSESHLALNRGLTNSIERFEPNQNIVNRLIPQFCSTGSFESDGWNNAMLTKMNLLISAWNRPSEFVIHVDSDVQFFAPFVEDIKQQLGEKSIAFQADFGPSACMGLFIFRKNELVYELFQRIKTSLLLKNVKNDQVAMNILLQELPQSDFGYLDERYYSPWRQTQGGILKEMLSLHLLPENIVALHSNYTIGIELKERIHEQARGYKF